MQIRSVFRRSLWLAVPAVLSLSACSKDDEPAAPDQGKVKYYHAAASANVSVKMLLDDSEKATLTYGQASDYQNVAIGAHTIKVNVASSGVTAASQAVTIEKDKNYSFFAYAPSVSGVGGLLVNDDLTVTTGKAKIRLVHLGQGAVTPLKLSGELLGSFVDIPNQTPVEFGQASQFLTIDPGAASLVVTTGSPSVRVLSVGDGTGAGTGTKTFEAGKIYSVVVRGVTNPLLDATLQPRAYIVQHN